MRINKWLAQATGLSRRAADRAVQAGRVTINGRRAVVGDEVADDAVSLDGKSVRPGKTVTIMLNKPVGYVCSRQGQGSQTIYDLLPDEYHQLKPVGRLDKDSSGLLLLTNDGDLANRLSHPRYVKTKVYEVSLDRALAPSDRDLISRQGVQLEDGPSKLALRQLRDERHWQIEMHEGRNRQIRRTFAALRYKVVSLNRTHFGDHQLGDLPSGKWTRLSSA